MDSKTIYNFGNKNSKQPFEKYELKIELYPENVSSVLHKDILGYSLDKNKSLAHCNHYPLR